MTEADNQPEIQPELQPELQLQPPDLAGILEDLQIIRGHLYREAIARSGVSARGNRSGNLFIDDLFQAAMLGAWQAGLAWDNRFRYSRRNYMISRGTYSIIDEQRKLDHLSRGERQKLKSDYGEVDSLGIGKLSNLLEEDMPRFKREPLSLEYMNNPEDGSRARPLSEVIGADDPNLLNVFTDHVDENWSKFFALFLTSLRIRHAEIFARYYVDGKYAYVIGNEFGVTESRIAQIRKEIFLTLKSAIVRLTGGYDQDEPPVKYMQMLTKDFPWQLGEMRYVCAECSTRRGAGDIACIKMRCDSKEYVSPDVLLPYLKDAKWKK